MSVCVLFLPHVAGSVVREGIQKVLPLLNVQMRVPRGCAGPAPHTDSASAFPLQQFHPRFTFFCFLPGPAPHAEVPCFTPRFHTLPTLSPHRVVCEKLGVVGGVKGAAFGAQRELRTRDALSQVMRAVGTAERVAPAELTTEQLRAVFERFQDPFGTIGAGRLGDMLKAVGLATPGADSGESRLGIHAEVI